jgi:hypothetical protein
MIDAAGPYLLVLMLSNPLSHGKGLAIQEMKSLTACRSALVQLEPIRNIQGVCIAAQTLKDKDAN